MNEHGLEIRASEGITRLQLGCQHQRGLLYMVPGEKSWVCPQETLPAHALAGFLGELTDLQHPEVQRIMSRWGVYFRRLPLDEAQGQEEGPEN